MLARAFAPLFPLVLLALCGCGSGSDSAAPKGGTPTPTSAKSPDEVEIEALFGRDNYQKYAPKMSVGAKVKLKGSLFYVPEKRRMSFSTSQLVEGDVPAAKASDLARDYLADPKAAAEKYKSFQDENFHTVVEGIVSEMPPDRYSIWLKSKP